MVLIGLLLNLAAITVAVTTATANHHDGLTLSPSDSALVRYTNGSLIVQCTSSSPDAKLHWTSPKNEIIREHKGRIHIEQQTTPDQLKLVFAHIALADKGNWTCQDANSGATGKSFDLIVYQKITFTENATILTVKEGRNATILCEVKGEPQPNVTWNYNGQPITIDMNSTKFRILADGLLINKVTQNDTGEYTCRAYQVNPITSDMQERTILMKIEHKPFWTHKDHLSQQYAYINGSVTITCEAIAEPPANFTWWRNKKRLQNDNHYTIASDNYISTLTINVHGGDYVFGMYKCRAQNHLGGIERNTTLEKGTKPPRPTMLKLRGLNWNTFDVDVGSVRTTPVKHHMDPNGFRIEYMTDYEWKADAAQWTNAKRKDFPFEDGATFLIGNLEENTTYHMRAATHNRAGYSDWTPVQIFQTLSNEPKSASATIGQLSSLYVLCLPWVLSLLCKVLRLGLDRLN